jgi:hypothetical protein
VEFEWSRCLLFDRESGFGGEVALAASCPTVPTSGNCSNTSAKRWDGGSTAATVLVR